MWRYVIFVVIPLIYSGIYIDDDIIDSVYIGLYDPNVLMFGYGDTCVVDGTSNMSVLPKNAYDVPESSCVLD